MEFKNTTTEVIETRLKFFDAYSMFKEHLDYYFLDEGLKSPEELEKLPSFVFSELQEKLINLIDLKINLKSY